MATIPFDGAITIDGRDMVGALTGFSQTVDEREGWCVTVQGPDGDALALLLPSAASVYVHVETGGRVLTGPLFVHSRIEQDGMVRVEMLGAPPLQV